MGHKPFPSWSTVGAGSPFDPQHKFVTSPVFSAPVLASIRLLFALYALCTICTVLAVSVSNHEGSGFFSYFTELSYVGLIAYFWASAVQTAWFARYNAYPLRRWPKALQALHVLLHSTIITYPFLVTVVYWALLASPEVFRKRFSAYENLSMHAINSLFALFELFLTNAPPAPLINVIPCVLMLAAYLGIAYITHATQGFYPYPFLDPQVQHGFLAVYIVLIAAGEVLVFFVVYGISVLRQRLAVRRGHLRMDSDVDAPPAEAIDQWEEVEAPEEDGRPMREREGARAV
ncbi:hypothetical protein C8J57DRAFT_45356 [Mycena rebaudengoi]|nr:hypothetical protein C8J57DRAFT_45356 [Mycena rebaudengoi]